MRWKDVNLNPTTRLLREFGGIVCVLCVFLAGREQFLNHRGQLAIILLGIAVLFALIGVLKPNWLKVLFVASIIVTFPIGWVVSQLILAVLYFGLITPLAIVFRLSGRDALNLRDASDQKASFWSPKTVNPDKRSYFKQF